MNGKRQKTWWMGALILILALVLPAQAAYGDADSIDPVINEFVFNHDGTDTNEYVEARGDPSTDYAALTLLEIEGDGTGAGVIDGVFAIGATNAEGYWTTGFLNNKIENGTVTVLLVEGFTGSAGTDLDTNNDGILDSTPWTRIVDDVAVSDGGSSDFAYAGTVLSGGFDGISLTPGGASRIPDGADTDTVDDWTRNDFDGAGLPGFTGSPAADEAINTPEAINQVVVVLPEVVINEVDADTPSTDVLEFVELYDGSVGSTTLDGLVVVFYNGSSDVSYAAYDLDGYTTDADGYFVLGNSGVSPDLTFGSNGLQNGADAVALYAGDATAFPNGTALTTDNLIDAIVYDTNDGDDAELLVLLNAGQPQVNEGGAGDKDNHSNQRCPNGAGGARNTDAYIQATSTPGGPSACPVPEILINEVDADTPSTDVLEFVELYDGGVGSINLDGLVVVFYNGNGDVSYAAYDLDGYTTDANGYFVLGNSGVSPDLTFGSNGLQNGADAVALYAGDATAFPSGTALTTDNLIDAIVYDTNDGDDAGLLALLNAGQPQVNEAGAGDKDNHSNQRCPNGAGGARNTNAYIQSTPTPGGPSACPVPEILINEVDADTPSTDVLEFVELYAGGAGSINLDGLVVVFYNGNGDVSYAAYDLDGYTTDADGYFVLGNSGVSPDLTFGSNGLQNGADAVALYAGDATAFPNGTALTTDNLIDAIVYDTNDGDDAGLLALLNAGQPQVNEGGAGDKDNHSNQRCPNGAGGARNTDAYIQSTPTPRMDNNCGGCGTPADMIHAIQGSGPESTMVGDLVSVEAVVVGDFQGSAELKGYFLQEEDADVDADAATSEGIFVYDPSLALDVSLGQVIHLQGTVAEYNGLTELTYISGVQVCAAGASVTPATVELPLASQEALEPYEGMQVFLPQELTVSENYDLGRYGELILSNGRLMNPTNVTDPGAPAIALQAANDLNRIVLDDGSTVQNPDPIVHPAPGLSALNTLRGGDTVQGIGGVLTYGFDAYRVHAVTTPAFVSTNARTADPEPVAGSLKVASFNVLNYFTTFGARGADNQQEFDRQRAKIVSALAAIDADIVGLIEIENNATTAIQDLVAGLNAQMGAGTYAFIDTGVIGTDEIKVAFLYKPASVSPAGGYAILDASVDPRFIDTKNRPALAQTFEQVADGARLTVAVNHLKSKGSDCNDLGDPDTGDGQGNCNLTRTRAAEALVDWLATDPTGSGDPDVLIIGDLNAYAMEDPIAAIKNAGYTKLIQTEVGAGAYSYVFYGQAGYLDHALANVTLTEQVSGVTAWHINADEPSVLDYNTEYKSPGQIDSLYNDDPYRASDHDPVIVGLNLNAPPDCAAATPSIDTIWPPNHKFVTVRVVGVSDPEGDPFTLTIDGIWQDEPVDETGDGSTAPDGLGIGKPHARVRAERDGAGNGRVYHIYFTAADAYGSRSGELVVSVPKSKKQVAVDEGPLFDSTVE